MNSQESKRLRDLRGTLTPPAGLEVRVTQALWRKGLICTSQEEKAMKGHYVMMAAVALGALLVGFVTGQQIDHEPAVQPTDERSQFVMLLYEDDSYEYPAPGGMAERIGEYSQWAREVAAKGQYVAGQKLADGGLLIAKRQPPSEGIPTAEEGIPGGYFIIRADSIEEAAQLAATCPHVRYGGSVSLRRIEG